MVGYHNGAGPGLQGLLGAANGHDALDDKGLFGVVNDLAQLLHGFAACRGGQPLQEGQARRVDVHGHGHRVRLAHGVQLGKHRLHVPGLHRGNARAAGGGNGVQRSLHHGGVGAVAGEGGDARLGAGGHQNVVIGQIVVFIPIVELHGSHRGGKNRRGKRPAKHGEGGVDGGVFADGVHVDAHLLPLLIVAQHGGGGTLAAGAGDLGAAGHAVAHGTCLAVGAAAFPGILENFTVIHNRENLLNCVL